MPWRGHKGHFCHICGGHRDVVGRLSARYKCEACSASEMIGSIAEMRARSGPVHERWRKRTLAGLGIVVSEKR